MNWLAKFSDRFWKWWIFGIVWLLGGALWFTLIRDPQAEGGDPRRLFASAAVWGICSVLAFMLSLYAFMFFLPRLLSSHRLGLGWIQIGAHWVTDIRVSLRPFEGDRVVDRNFRGSSKFRHALYNDQRCLDAVLCWLCLEAPEGAPESAQPDPGGSP